MACKAYFITRSAYLGLSRSSLNCIDMPKSQICPNLPKSALICPNLLRMPNTFRALLNLPVKISMDE